MGTARSIKAEAIRQAVASGEFLVVDPDSSSRISGPFDIDLRRLADCIDRYSALYERLDKDEDSFTQVVQQINEGSPTVAFPPDALTFLFAADDRLVDILRLSGALLRYVLDPSVPYASPVLRPVSPLEDAVEGLDAETASHGDVEGWVQDDVLWGLLTDKPVSDPERSRASRERYPRFWKTADDELSQRVEQIARRYGAELLRRKEIYGEEAANQWLDQVLDRDE